MEALVEYLIAAILILSGYLLPVESNIIRMAFGVLGFAMLYFGGYSIFASFEFSNGSDAHAVKRFRLDLLIIVLLFFTIYTVSVVW